MYSNDLFVCKEQLCECMRNVSLNIDYNDVLETLDEPIDINKFEEWLRFSIGIIQTKQNKQSYFKKAFISELNKGRFKMKKLSIDTSSLIKAIRHKGIPVVSNDTCYIEIMWSEILKAGMPIDKAVELNHKVIDFLKSDQIFNDYVSLVKNSKALAAYKINWETIQSIYYTEIDNWDKMLNELSEGEFYEKDD